LPQYTFRTQRHRLTDGLGLRSIDVSDVLKLIINSTVNSATAVMFNLQKFASKATQAVIKKMYLFHATMHRLGNTVKSCYFWNLLVERRRKCTTVIRQGSTSLLSHRISLLMTHLVQMLMPKWTSISTHIYCRYLATILLQCQY